MDDNQKISSYRKVIAALYLTVIAAMMIMVIANVVFKDPEEQDFYALEDFVSITESWMTEAENHFDTSEIDSLRKENTDHVSIFYHIKDTITQQQSILFRSKNCTVNVLVDGVKCYESEIASAPFYNHSAGTRWNLVKISPEDAGQTVELQIYQDIQDGRAKVDNFYSGDRASIILYLIFVKLWGIVISIIIFLIAVVFVIAWAILNWQSVRKEHSLLWLSVFAMAASCWCLLETNIFRFFWNDLRLIQVIDNMMLVIAGMALYLYLDSTYGTFGSKTVRILCGLDMAYIVFAIAVRRVIGFSSDLKWSNYHIWSSCYNFNCVSRPART